jgi:hypothetical protein
MSYWPSGWYSSADSLIQECGSGEGEDSIWQQGNNAAKED